MVLSAQHWRPLLNGYSGFAPTSTYLRGLLYFFPSPDAVRLLADLRVRFVVIHAKEVKPGTAALCTAPTLPRELRLAYRDERDCVLEVRGTPPRPPVPPDRPIAIGDATVESSAGDDATAAIDGDLDTHWVQPVDKRTDGWLQLDFAAPRALSRIVLELGPHYGEHLRQWRVETSPDGVAWERVASQDDGTAVPPLTQMMHDPTHLSTELRLPPGTFAQHLRIVRTAGSDVTPWDLWGNWSQWGVHEIVLFAPTT
jgi:hypothetical protein